MFQAAEACGAKGEAVGANSPPDAERQRNATVREFLFPTSSTRPYRQQLSQSARD